MSRLRSIVGWMVRGGDQTRADLAEKTAAIEQLQQQVETLRGLIDERSRDADRTRAGAAESIDDLADRLSAITVRVDHLDGLVADHDDSIASLGRVVGSVDPQPE